ncbi:DUF1800 family protein [Mucilaginibacter sp. L3T2-6]|uniref:DUF1800 domain-containing protein n=1 Tax=Mucilaginibacter sp. L3T2-6 TaxID=3062491 RepID=UPI0026753B51|nr:DUF1800 domain-containing protein [Mucilaginibacter sp. L3T2-6]MDO3642026.1 DUF1800 domain-containing protein [Mucilaginibacter sp. L3T2-6]MDV6214296.1 DUF1800 domain-containing protein [Mucilaginibacter sp. L3T2-6]
MDNLRQIKHLYARAGFGLRFDEINAARNLDISQALTGLFKSSENYQPLDIITGDAGYTTMLRGDKAERKQFMQLQRRQERSLNEAWMERMSNTDAVLREKMTLFWHNHFACRTRQAQFAQQLNNIQREHALGNFRELVLEVSRSPAMLQFLNNQQNRKGHPNENFARELMELFTIGRGNYTEQDVKESARAFTGWGFNKDGKFAMRSFLHDDGEKRFLGKTGNLTGEDIIDRLLGQKQTAVFISTKLYKYLVNETPDAGHIAAMADVFYRNNYEIKPLLQFVFTAPWFYGEQNVGNIVKSPVELLVGLNRQFYVNYQRPEIMLQFQKVLGQVLFYPPNVAGWPGGRNWIDSSSLMYRLKIPSIILNGGVIDFKGKADPEEEAYIAASHNQQQFVNARIQAQADWDKLLKSIPPGTSKNNIAAFILQPPVSKVLATELGRAADIKTALIQSVSTPEYQLC